MHQKPCNAATNLALTISRCTSTKPPVVQLQIREFQTRAFDHVDQKSVLKAMFNDLQDERFIIKQGNLDLGLLYPEKQVDVENTTEAALAVLFLGANARRHVQKVGKRGESGQAGTLPSVRRLPPGAMVGTFPPTAGRRATRPGAPWAPRTAGATCPLRQHGRRSSRPAKGAWAGAGGAGRTRGSPGTRTPIAPGRDPRPRADGVGGRRLTTDLRGEPPTQPKAPNPSGCAPWCVTLWPACGLPTGVTSVKAQA